MNKFEEKIMLEAMRKLTLLLARGSNQQILK